MKRLVVRILIVAVAFAAVRYLRDIDNAF